MRHTTRMKLLAATATVVCVATVSIPGWAKAPRRESTAATRSATHHRAARGSERRGGSERWDITVTRADDHVLEGHVTRSGAHGLQGGRIFGTFAGRRVSGTVTDPAGALLASFIGTISRRGGMSGTYHDRGGTAGRWTWEGPLVR